MSSPSRRNRGFQFDPIELLDAIARPADENKPNSVRELRSWQRRMRLKLAECIGFLDEKPVDPRPIEIQRVDRGSYVRHKIILRTTAHSQLPLYLLVPNDIKKPRPCVLALHGHGYGVKDIVGLWEDGTERESPEGYQADFGVALAQRGFVVAAPEISCFGERQIRHPERYAKSSESPPCHAVATYCLMLGKSALGLRVLDAMRVIDWLETRKEIDADRIGTMGISGGGMNAFFAAALDERIKAAVISGYFCDWRPSTLSLYHCTCNFAPGLLRLGELSDLAGLIAPRPCLVEHGARDEIFPIAAVKETVAKARRAWGILGAQEKLVNDYFEGRHQIHGKTAYEFLARHLRI